MIDEFSVLRALRVSALALLLGCAGGPAPGRPAAREVIFFVSPAVDFGFMEVEACSPSRASFGRWSAPWSRIEVLEGTRRGDALDASARGCVRYRVTLEANRQTLTSADGAVLLSAQSEWLLRPRGGRARAEVHFALAAGQDVATAWPRAPARARSAGGAEARPREHVEGFELPELALELPSDVLMGRFEQTTRQVAATTLTVARVPGALAHDPAELSEHIANAVAMVASVGGAFPSERVLAIVWPSPGDQPVLFGLTKRGGGTSILLFFGAGAPLGSLRDDWVTVHELAHLLHPRVPAADRWLSEGIATYYQEVLRARFGWKTPVQAWSRMVAGFETGRAAGTGRTLAEEAEAMSRTGAYTRVYWGGTAFALEADMRLRARGSSLDEAIARGLRDVERGATPVSARELIARMDPELRELGDVYAARSAWPETGPLLEALGVVSGGDEVRLVDAPASGVRDAIMSPR